MTTATIITIIIILLTLAHFYLKSSTMMSFSTLMAALFATVLAFSFHEMIAQFFISRGHGMAWAPAGCYMVVFVFAFAVIRTLAEMLVGSAIDFGKTAKSVMAICCGLLTGLFIAGNLLVAMGLLPVQHKLAYSRFAPDKPITLNRPSIPLLNPDGLVTGFYSWLSRGSLASIQSFAVVQSDFLSRSHLNRYRIAENVPAITSPKSLVLPAANKHPVRIWPVPEEGDLTVVRLGLVSRSIPDGGAGNEGGQIKFIPAQLRLICKPTGETENLRGSGQAVLPVGFLRYRIQGQPRDGKEFVGKDPGDIVEDTETLGIRDRILWVDAAFKIPSGQAPVAIQFKQNATASLIGMRPEPTSAEIEEGLDVEKKDAEAP